MSKDARVDSYISSLTKLWWKDTVLQLRVAIHDADPEIFETIKWGTPYFEHNGGVAWLFCAEEWVHFAFPQGALLDSSHGLFEEGSDTTSKAKRTIKIREGENVPKEAIKKLIKQAVANNLAGKRIDFKIPKKGEKAFDLPREYETFLKAHGQLEEYLARSYYQQRGWVEWIEQAKHEETRAKRREQMLRELRDGSYMPPKRTLLG